MPAGSASAALPEPASERTERALTGDAVAVAVREALERGKGVSKRTRTSRRSRVTERRSARA